MKDLFYGIDGISFGKRFKNNEDCYEYLYSIKWEKGYSCIRCGCKAEVKGATSFHRRCKGCGYDESVTSNTLFHNVKMPILKAFHMLFRTVTKKKGMSSIELSTEVGVQQKTAWFFKLKIKNAMIQEDKKKLEGKVQVDETLVGGYSKGNIGRSLEQKTAVLIAVEELPDGRTGSLQMQVIENFKKDTLEVNINEMVAKDATLKTDKFKSYVQMKNEGKDIEMEESANGKFLEELHKQILQFKNWLKGTHHKCSDNYLQTYINEYEFRFNRRNYRAGIFNSIIFKIMNAVPKRYCDLLITCSLNT
jgi:transposase-like protein